MSTVTVSNLDSFTIIPIEKGERRNIVTRFSSGLVFSPMGRCDYTQNGKTFVSDNEHVLYLPKGGTYTINCIKSDFCPLINFDILPEFDEIKSFKVENSKQILEGFYEISGSWIFNKKDIYYHAMSYLYEMFAKLQSGTDSAGKIPEIILKAQNFIEKNYTDPKINICMIASNLCISEVYLRKLFCRYFGIPPMKYINTMRINQAKIMLKNQMMNIGFVAEYCGFSSLYSFSRAFKNTVGCPPSEYRKMKIPQQ